MVLQATTREAIRVSVGRNCRAVRLITAGVNGSTTTFLTDDLWGGADDHNGKWWLGTDAPNDEVQARVTDTTVSANRTTLTLHPAVSSTNNSDTAELWDNDFNPEDIHEFINEAIIEATGAFYDPIEDITLFADGDQTRFDTPANISMIKQLLYRSSFKGKTIHNASSAWTAGSNVTVATDTELKKRGTASNKLTLAAGVSAGGVVAYKDITSIDLSDYTHVEWWARCSKTTTAADLKLLLDNTAGSTSPIELLDFPALTADTWTFCRAELDKADEDTAIVSVGIEDDTDIGAETVWIDDVRAVHNDEVRWTPLPRRLWRVDRNARDIILTNAGKAIVGYAMLKIIGGDKPALLTSDATATEVPDFFIIARATALALASAPDINGQRSLSGHWMNVANREYRKMPILQNVRVVE
jgi:hypothetical protein